MSHELSNRALSGEIARKVIFSERLIDGANFLCVYNPKDVSSLAKKIKLLVESSELRNSLAHHGGVLSRIIESGAIEIDNLVSHAESIIVDDDRAAENV